MYLLAVDEALRLFMVYMTHLALLI